MSNQNWLKENLDYGKELASSALKGADTARREVLHEHEVVSEISRAAKDSWQPAIIGAVVGALVAYLTDERKSSRTIAAGGVVGAAVGFSGSVIWNSRAVTGPIAKGAIKRVNETRDQHWLEKNPVVYG
jgi:uncharacterized protein YcfJ